MITFILSCILEAVLAVYVIIALMLFLQLATNDYSVTITNTETKEKTNVSGSKKLKYLILVSLLWPISLKFSE